MIVSILVSDNDNQLNKHLQEREKQIRFVTKKKLLS